MNNSNILFVIAIVRGEFTMLMLKKYGFKVGVILFGFNSTHYKVYIHIPCINTHQRTTAPFYITHIISYIDHWTPRLFQGSADHSEEDHNSDIICLLQTYQSIHNCNQSVLAIVLDLNIFVWSIAILDLI